MSRINQLLVAGAAMVALGASTAGAATWYTYDGNALPQSSTPAWNQVYKSAGAHESASGGILTVTTDTIGDYIGYQMLSPDWNAAGNGSTLEVRLKVDWANNADNLAGSFDIYSGSQQWLLGIGNGSIASLSSFGEGFSVTLDDAFHTLRFVVSDEAAGKLSVYVDGNTTPAYSFTGSTSGSNQLVFGDTTGGNVSGSIQYDYITWTNDGAFAPAVPEPASLSLLAIGGSALLARRRSRQN